MNRRKSLVVPRQAYANPCNETRQRIQGTLRLNYTVAKEGEGRITVSNQPEG